MDHGPGPAPPPFPASSPAGAGSRFVGERIRPAGGEFARPPAVGEPGLPLCFAWRRLRRRIVAVARQWNERTPDRTHGSGQMYLRRHWFALRMDDGAEWLVYFERQPRSRRAATARWWLYQLRGDPAVDGIAGR